MVRFSFLVVFIDYDNNMSVCQETKSDIAALERRKLEHRAKLKAVGISEELEIAVTYQMVIAEQRLTGLDARRARLCVRSSAGKKNMSVNTCF